MRSEELRRYLVCVAAGLLLLRLLGPAWRTGFAAVFPDSSSYVDVADHGPLSAEMWFGRRPPVYPLLIWIVGPSPRAVIVVQSVLAVLAWGWLCSTVWRELRSRAVATAAIVVLLLVAVQTRWMFWNTALLTESLSATLAVAGVAAWWRWFSEPVGFRLVAATAVTAAWMLLRDSNAMTMLVVLVPALAVASVLRRRRGSDRRRGMVAGLVALVAVGAFSLTGQLVSDRGETSFHNNVGLRWLPDDDIASWMEARGLPMSDALVARTGSDAWADGEAFLRAPELAEYREWVGGRGRIAAAWSFVARADWYVDRFLDDLPGHTGSDLLSYDTFGVAEHFPERPLGVFDPVASPQAMAVWTLAAVAAFAVALAARRRTEVWMLTFLGVPVVADLYLVYVADAIEVGRHLVGPFLRFSVVAVVTVAIGADIAVDELSGAGRTSDDVGSGRSAPDDPSVGSEPAPDDGARHRTGHDPAGDVATELDDDRDASVTAGGSSDA